MNAKINAIARELKNSVQLKELELSDISTGVAPIISVLKEGYTQVKDLICNSEFENKEDEITFFKETKPKMFYKLIYYYKILGIEQHRPVCGYESIKEYLETEQKIVNFFFHKNNEFIQYYKSGGTMLDEPYFLRNSTDLECNVESFSFERDADFSTNYDYKVTEMLANELLATYLDAELVKLKRNEYQLDHSDNLLGDKWTDLKSALVELVYAIHATRSVNHGNIDIKVLTAKFSKMFNIEIGDSYRTFLEIRNRKGNRTTYLSRLIESLNKRMDEADSK
jgi:hypothetical protein